MNMNNVRNVQKLNEQELKTCTPPTASWHTDYRHTAFIYIGGLPYTLSEGDIITIFSQYGEPVYIKLIRDKDTGKSKGFCFLKYEDQRSCDLAVDNLGGVEVLGRILRVDHANYKVKEGEDILDNTRGDEEEEHEEVDEEEQRRARRPELPEERELMKLEAEQDDDDPMKAYLLDEKRAEVKDAVARWEREHAKDGRRDRDRHRHHYRSHRDREDRDRRHRRVRDRSQSPADEGRRKEKREERDRPSKRRERSRSRSPKREDREEHKSRRRRESGDDSDGGRDRRRRRSDSDSGRRRDSSREQRRR